jgi:hypothetical protein
VPVRTRALAGGFLDRVVDRRWASEEGRGRRRGTDGLGCVAGPGPGPAAAAIFGRSGNAAPLEKFAVARRSWSAHHTSCGHAASIPTPGYGTPDKFFIPFVPVTSARSRPRSRPSRPPGARSHSPGEVRAPPEEAAPQPRSRRVGQGTIESRALPLVDTAKHARDVALVVRVAFVFRFSVRVPHRRRPW